MFGVNFNYFSAYMRANILILAESVIGIFCYQEIATLLVEDTIAVIGIFFNQGIATFLAEGEYDSSKRIILFGMFLQLF